MDNKGNTRLYRKTKRKKRKRLVILLPFLIILVSILSYGGFLYWKAHSAISDSFEDIGRDKSDLREKIVDPTKDNISILIIGVDSSEARKERGNNLSDTLMLATLNKHENSVKLLSIPRDTYVYVPAIGEKTKINHAHSKGGAKATIETVENLLEVPIDYYVSINFEAFIEIVDALGGITVDVPYEFAELDSKEKSLIFLKPGVQKLNGEEALALARTRKLDNDIERGKRQQEIIKAIIKKAVSVGSITKYDDVIEAVGNNMKTNMTFGEMRGLASYGLNDKNLAIESLTLKGSDYKPGKTYYYKLDEESLEETKQLLVNHLELDNSKTAINDDSNDNISSDQN
ncbi:transcriptional regulator [Caldibacillus thermoamylovorans]|uniref:Transcriptional regulator n=1 Tax=Caldibacillus thermoamylovorans TaxID=35841 RepID=A0A090IZ63_9BACI|nr:LCP family protein [Caldibacillus thermoamylovorans]CEE03042.1 transcriptional regulator [Caldibacillus thermoamylovorans]